MPSPTAVSMLRRISIPIPVDPASSKAWSRPTIMSTRTVATRAGTPSPAHSREASRAAEISRPAQAANRRARGYDLRLKKLDHSAQIRKRALVSGRAGEEGSGRHAGLNRSVCQKQRFRALRIEPIVPRFEVEAGRDLRGIDRLFGDLLHLLPEQPARLRENGLERHPSTHVVGSWGMDVRKGGCGRAGGGA